MDNKTTSAAHIASLEAELHSTRAQLTQCSEIIRRNPVVIIIRKGIPNWPIQFISASVERFGYLPEDFTSDRIRWDDIIEPDDYTRIHDEIHNAIEHGMQRIVVEYRIRSKSGTTHWVEDNLAAIYTENGRLAELQENLFDITLRKQIEEQLRSHQDILQLFFTHVPAAVAMFDRNMCYLAVSQRWMTDYRLGDQSIIGRCHYDIFPEIEERWKEFHRRALAGEILRCDEDPFTRFDGTIEWIRWEIVPWRRADGEIGGIIIFSEDITQRKRAEEERERLLAEVKRHAAELEATITAIADGLIVYGPSAEIIRINHVAENLLAYSPDIRSRGIEERLALTHLYDAAGHPISAQTFPALRALSGETIHGEIYTFIRPSDGREFWVAVSAAPMYAPDGKTYGAVVTISNITELHNLQQQQENFLNIVSHDLRNPLSVANGHIQLLENFLDEHNIDSTARLSVTAISRSIQRMNSMIQDLADIARFAGGKLTLTIESLDLSAFVANLLERMQTVLDISRIVTDIP
ncbi:MAG TPA: PAS domain S-box protein, partial [Armatimonadota bacterium]|nr:PAS domain S-box protein [Armatimonadota bacterium]